MGLVQLLLLLIIGPAARAPFLGRDDFGQSVDMYVPPFPDPLPIRIGRAIARAYGAFEGSSSARRRQREMDGWETQAERTRRLRHGPPSRRTLRLIRAVPKGWRAALILALIPSIVGAAGQIFYVSPTGSNGNAGTSVSPWASAQFAADTATTDDTVRFYGGTYTQANSLLTTSKRLTFENVATETATLIRSSQGQGLIRLTGSGQIFRSNPSGGFLQLDYTSTYGNEVLPSGNTAQYLYSAIVLDGGSGCVVDGIKVLHAYGICAAITGTDQTVQNCDLAHGGYGVQANGSHANGCVRPVIQDNRIHHMDRMMQNDNTGASNDHGSEGINLTHGFTGAKVLRNLIYECHTIAGSFDYWMDGGTVSVYGGLGTIQTEIAYNRCWNNHGFIEAGTEGSWNNGNVWIHHNLVYGEMDYQHQGYIPSDPGTVGKPGGATTPMILLRANPNWIIEHNTFHRTRGSQVNGGMRFATGGGFAGALDNVIIRSNAFYLALNEHALNAGALTAWPAGFDWDHNHVFRLTHSFGQAGAYPAASINVGNPSYPYSSTGLTSFRNGTPYADNDAWGSDPNFTDATTTNLELRDYTPRAGSPLLGTAHDGTNIGAVAEGPGASYVWQDTFTRTVVDGWGTPDIGVGYIQGGPTRLDVAGGVGTIQHTANNQGTWAVTPVSLLNSRIRGRVKFASLPTGADWQVELLFRDSPDSDWLTCCIRLTPAGAVQGQFIRRVANLQVSISGPTAFPDALPTYVPDTWLAFDGYVDGTGPSNMGLKVWREVDVEPTTWLTTTDSTGPAVAGWLGIRTQNGTGTATGFPLTSIDDLQAVDLDVGVDAIGVAGRASATFSARGATAFGGINATAVAARASATFSARAAAATGGGSGTAVAGRAAATFSARTAAATGGASQTADAAKAAAAFTARDAAAAGGVVVAAERATATFTARGVTKGATATPNLGASYAWTTDFATPLAPADFTVTPEPGEQGNVLEWTLVDQDPYFYAWNIYAQIDGAFNGQYVLIKTITDPDAIEFTYHAAPQNREQAYRLTQDTGAIDVGESEPAEGSGELMLSSYNTVVPADPSLTGDMGHVKGGSFESETAPRDIEIMSPIRHDVDPTGRSYKVPVVHDVWGPEDSFRAYTDDEAVITRLQRLDRDATETLLKTPGGRVHFGIVMDVRVVEESVGFWTITGRFLSTGPPWSADG